MDTQINTQMNNQNDKTIQEKVEEWINNQVCAIDIEGDHDDPNVIEDNWGTYEDWLVVLPYYAEADYLPAIQKMHCYYGLCVQTSNPGPRVKAWLESRIPKRWAPLTNETFELWDQYTVRDLQTEAWPCAYPPPEYIKWLVRRGEYERANELINE